MLKKFAAIACAAVLFASPGLSETLRAVTYEGLTPFTRDAKADLPGFNVELMNAVAERAGFDLETEYLPWKRAQKVAEDEPDTIVFGLGRNKKREPKYKWVMNLLTAERVFVSLGDPINSIEDARGLGQIGSRSLYYTQLENEGFTNISNSDVNNLQKLKAGRVDAVYTVSSRAVFVWSQELGFAPEDLAIGTSISPVAIWLAAHKDFDDAKVERLQKALKELVADGTYDGIHKKYFGDLPVLPL
ncbi:substrate-binding periplasmic protein [Pseudophaeobacter leonis]|uniref:substrate-binding periplasmic protein n=1 Tax=Pseudophaeobacter leonis TaxID=1144477 RepID=UPI0009F209DF|nr:transporter substrate-binding domain-containing protein [Pseudophaeobacter leonis]